MACKTFANIYGKGELLEKLKTSYREARRRGIRHPTFRKLLDGEYLQREPDQLSLFAANDILDEQAEDEADIEKKAALLSERFERAHRMALENTELYLSLVNDLDVYVATSMRTKEHFMEMARFAKPCSKATSCAHTICAILTRPSARRTRTRTRGSSNA